MSSVDVSEIVRVEGGFVCPRRTADGNTSKIGEPPHFYDTRHGLVGSELKCCTYCGSMSPEDFVIAAKSGASIGPTDKSYKLYINPGGSWTEKGKFYTHHFLLRSDLAVEFRRMVLDHEVNIGYPGYFYSKLWLPIDKPDDGRD